MKKNLLITALVFFGSTMTMASTLTMTLSYFDQNRKEVKFTSCAINAKTLDTVVTILNHPQKPSITTSIYEDKRFQSVGSIDLNKAATKELSQKEKALGKELHEISNGKVLLYQEVTVSGKTRGPYNLTKDKIGVMIVAAVLENCREIFYSQSYKELPK